MSTPNSRVRYYDLVRGFAVVAMLVWHATDSWLADEYRHGAGFGWMETIGGMAAPLFLLLSGSSMMLAFQDSMPSNKADLIATVQWNAKWSARHLRFAWRSVRIVLSGYALKMFGYAVDQRALFSATKAPATWTGILALWSTFAAFDIDRTHVQRRVWRLVAALSWAMALAMDHPLGLFRSLGRLDVLHAIGIGLLVLQAFIWLAVRRTGGLPKARYLFAAALIVVLANKTLTQTFAASFHADGVSLEAHLARYVFRREADLFPARFPLLPWFGYPLAGAAFVGFARSLASPDATKLKDPRVLFALSTTLILLSTERGIWLQNFVGYFPHTWNLTRLVFYASCALWIGSMSEMLSGSTQLFYSRVMDRMNRFLISLGQNSLELYVAHIPIVFGLASKPLHRSLNAVQTSFAAICLLCIASLFVRAWTNHQQALRKKNALDSVLHSAGDSIVATKSAA